MPTSAATAAEQLHRLLLVLPTLADDQAHSIAEIAAQIGVAESVIVRDLADLVTRVSDEPGGFTEGVSLLIGENSVQFQTGSGHFRRPMGLTRDELHALELGLAMLAQELPPDEHEVLHRARTRLVKAMAQASREDDARSPQVAALSPETAATQEIRQAVQRCIRDRRVLRITYRSASATAATARDVQPLGIVWSRGAWFLVAWCRRSDGLRVFRLDRITAAEARSDLFDTIDGFSLDDVLRDGRVLVGERGPQMRIRYSAHVARWIQEREGGELADDGSLVREMEAVHEAWAVRQVLRYGPDAVVLGPPDIRRAVRDTLDALTS